MSQLFLFRKIPYLSPIFFSDIFINFYRNPLTVKSVATVFFWARNPKFFPGLCLKIVCLVSSLKGLECLTSIIDRLTSLGECHATNPSLTSSQTS